MTQWLLIPMQPTPNGRLHIGHGGGPYLRADAIARSLRRDGEDASIVTGSDAYENWVLADGMTTGRTPEQTCQRYHAGIASDLTRLGIELDTWVDPLDPGHNHRYREIHERLLTTLRDSGRATLATERVPVGEVTGRDLLGVWIAGGCPTCGAAVGGSPCTVCGDQFSPAQLIDPHSRLTNEPIGWAERPSWFAYATDTGRILSALEATGLPDAFLTPARTYLNGARPLIRLSQPGAWGIASEQVPDGSVLCNSYYSYSLYCAQLYGEDHTTGNALLENSGVTVVGLFGTDNSIGGLVAPHVLAAGTGFKPFDHTVVSHMLCFQGRKCSTSKRHGIWIADLIDNTTVTSDELRYVLTQIPLDRHVCDIDVTAVVDTVNELRQWRTTVLARALDAVNGDACSISAGEELIAALDRQHQYLRPPFVDLADACKVLHEWMFDAQSSTIPAATWLLGTALLAVPIMPQLASQLWTACGLAGEPRRSVAVSGMPALAINPTALHLSPHQSLTENDVAQIVKERPSQ